jgi:hypothetical protein
MAVRIRKLARELDRTPTELIGVLHALGFQRYRSADDMLPKNAVAKLRKGLAAGVRPVQVDVREASAPRESDLERLARGDDLMSQLVPGVVHKDTPRRATPSVHTPPPRRPPSPPRASSSSAARPAPPPPRAQPAPVPASSRATEVAMQTLESQRRLLASEKAVVANERSELEQERARMDAREAALEAESAALTELRAALEAERAALAVERDTVAQRRSASSAVSLQALLEDRGLRGADEFERAVTALAEARLLRDVLWTVRLDPPDAMERVLKDKLLLGAGQPHAEAARGAAWVTVSPARSEVPDPAQLDRTLTALGERWMLYGFKRVRIVGGVARWHRVVRAGVDARIELIQQVVSTRGELAARADVADADLVILWNVEVTPEAAAIYEASRPSVVQVSDPHIGGFLETVLAKLDD